MLLGPAGEAYFVGEEVLNDNPYDEAFEVIEGQSSKVDNPEQRVRSSSAEPHPASLQGVLDGAGIDLNDKTKQAIEEADGYFLQELEMPDSPKSAQPIPKNSSGLWRSIFGYFRGPVPQS